MKFLTIRIEFRALFATNGFYVKDVSSKLSKIDKNIS